MFSTPSEDERTYLGFISQAYFGRHFLDSDPAAIALQTEMMTRTLFVFDSVYLIRLLARSALGHALPYQLHSQMRQAGCALITTELLLDEVVEHAQWAWRLLNEKGAKSSEVIDCLRGAASDSVNVFLQGYALDEMYGPDRSFQSYFDEMLKAGGEIPNSGCVRSVLEDAGVRVVALREYEISSKEVSTMCVRAEADIRSRRERYGTLRHDRQVQAEAQIAVFVNLVRQGRMPKTEAEHEESFFISPSRVVDQLPGLSKRVCIDPQVLYNWLLTMLPISPDDADALFDCLVWGLSEAGIDLVPRERLEQVFGSTVEASQAGIAEVKAEHRELVREKYAVDPDTLFSNVDPLATPYVEGRLNMSLLSLQEEKHNAQIERLREQALKAGRDPSKIEVDRKEYERLRQRDEERKRRAKQRERSRASSPKKRRKRSSRRRGVR